MVLDAFLTLGALGSFSFFSFLGLAAPPLALGALAGEPMLLKVVIGYLQEDPSKETATSAESSLYDRTQGWTRIIYGSC